jgi:uncharacterized protein
MLFSLVVFELKNSAIAMNNVLKIVVTGPVGAGKSTFIRTISEIEVVDTDRAATDETAKLKSKTTVAMDFGRITLGDNMWVHIYGTPGQERFDFMWDMLIQGASGYILLVPAHRPEDMRAARSIMSFMNQRTDVPMIVGVTHTDSPNAWNIEDIELVLSQSSAVIPVNPNDSQSVAESMLTLVGQLCS